MFLPIGDEPNPRGRPWVNQILLALNMGVFLLVSLPLMHTAPDVTDPATADVVRSVARRLGAPVGSVLQQLSAYDVWVFQYGFRPSHPSVGTLFTSLFLHAGWMHLLGNMLFLWIFGDNVEHFLGRFRYALMYLSTGVVATLFFAAFQRGSDVPLVGASGAISGVLGCYFIWFPKNRVRVLAVLFWYIDVLLIPARWVLGFYIVIENILPFLFAAQESHVAHGAHIGGFFAGMALAYTYADKSSSRAMEHIHQRSPLQSTATPTPERMLQKAVDHNLWDEALRIYAAMTAKQRQALDVETLFGLADGLVEEGLYDTALTLLQGFVSTHPLSPHLPRAHMRLGYTLWRGKKRPQAAYQHFLTVLDLHPHGEIGALARQAAEEIQQGVQR